MQKFITAIAMSATALAIAAPALIDTAAACTRVLWNTNKLAVVSSRTMDWPESTEPILTVFPRGISRDGSRVGPEVVVKDNPAKWTSKYGSIVTTVYDIGAVDGLNEKGLANSSALSQRRRFRSARHKQTRRGCDALGTIRPR